jgi:NAD(P)-dependent dehydrogenase (short-subunit alcohol dehydrogenase family)
MTVTHADPGLREFDRTVLVVGATGAFGERLAEGLIRSGFAVIGAARNTARLDALASRLGRRFAVEPLDRSRIDAARLTELRERAPSLFAVADASGPFQSSDYALPRAAIGAGLHYVDLADARAFVGGSRVLDGEGRAANVAVLAGASSTPALSHAVLDTLVAGSRKVIAIEVCIAPGNRAPRGLSTVHAVLSTVGKPIRVFRGCRWVEEVGWGLNKTIELPGVGNRRVALCETPDLDLLVERYNPSADAIFRAGLELRVLHEGVAALGLLVRLGILKSLAALARPLRGFAELFKPFGTDRGGMRVDVLLENDAGQLLRRVWTLAADGGDGLYVPTLPALAALKMLATGSLEWRGAGPCAGIIPYNAIAAEFGHHNIKTQTQEMSAPAPLFRRLLGDAYDALPPVIRQAHQVHGVLVLEGKADAANPDNVVGSLIARLFRLPRSGSDMPVRVEMRSEDDGSETWTRIYPGVTMRSNLRNADSATHQVDEFLGPLSIRLQWEASERGLQLRTISARMFGCPLPDFLRPRSHASETVGADGQFYFDVPIALPLIGTIVHYKGSLKPVEKPLPQ